jgi:predicted SprT family Zn-dependent metalloprotease
MKIKIPEKLKLMGQTIRVVHEDGLVTRCDAVGHARYRENTIALQKSTEGYNLSDEQIEETFLHELIHFVFYKLGERELMENEKLIDGMAGLLHQALRTME